MFSIHVLRIDAARQGNEALRKFVNSNVTAGLCIRSLKSTPNDDVVSVRRLIVCQQNLVLSSALHCVGEVTWALLGVTPFCFLYEKVKCVLMP